MLGTPSKNGYGFAVSQTFGDLYLQYKDTCRTILIFTRAHAYLYKHITQYIMVCPIYITCIHIHIFVRFIISTYLQVACQCVACVQLSPDSVGAVAVELCGTMPFLSPTSDK